MTLIVHSGDLDKLMAAFVIATGAAAAGKKVSMFFTFWGLNALKTGKRARGKTLLERMASWMMPSTPETAPSSRMNMLGLGPRFFRALMKRNNVPSLGAMVETAKQLGVCIIACRMSMDIVGIRESELVDGIQFGGVATYLLHAGDSNLNLFV